MIEAKEGCEASAQNETLARLSFQRFFRRYLRLAGMTGTAQEVAGELASVYGLNTVVVPTRRPVQRRNLGEDLYPTVDAKWAAVTEAVRVCHATERPVLVGTRSVAASEHLSTLLSAAGLPHEVINARQNEREAEIVAHAGEPGRITVATNMAGRGTDIPLTDASRAAGGLHVIAAERNESGRIDRQLFGRAARQGDPGSFQVVCALEDELCQTHLPVWLQRVLRRSRESARPLPPMLGRALIRSAQARAARLSRHERNDLLRLDQHLADTLAFAGRSE
jgi:preprotein translocase subunit SecA